MNRRLHPARATPLEPWLESVELAGEQRSFSGHRLRYHPFIPAERLRLRLALRSRSVQQVILEHAGHDQVLATEVLAVENGRIEWNVQLVRGWNRFNCYAPGEPSKTFTLDVVHRTQTREWIETLLYALTFALLIRTFLLQVFVLPVDSPMEASRAGDRVLVNRIHYAFSPPSSGDLAVLEYSQPGQPRFVIKRVAGAAGQTLETRGARVLVDDRPLGSPFDSLEASGITSEELPNPVPRMKIPDGALFLMSTSQVTGSRPSAWWGFLTDRTVLGKAIATFAPWERRGWVR